MFNFKIILITLLVSLAGILHAQQYPGYTLYSLKNASTALLVDTNGTTFHTWTSTGKTTCYSTYMMPGGILWRTLNHTGNSFSGGPISGEVQKLDYAGNVLWDYVYSTASYCTHHDICPMPNGNVLMIAYESKSAAEVTAAGCSQYSGIMWPEKIVEIQPTGTSTGNVVWEWHAWDHLVQNTNSAAANYQTSIINHPELLNINYNSGKDWLHINGVDYNPILDQITFTSHNLSELYVVDHSTTTAEAATHSGGNSGKGGDILYRWGNPLAYGVTATKIFNVVHHAHWVPEGNSNAGDLFGYNNQGILPSASCTDFFTPPISGYNYSINLGSAYLPATYNKRLPSGGYNSNEGSAQQLPNGNVLISMGISGYIKEFDPSGTLIWSKTLTGSSAKAFRYSECYLNNIGPSIPTITENVGVLTSDIATTYQWYLNGLLLNGETNQIISPLQSGIYVVRVTDINGCVYQYSAGYHFNLTTGISQAATSKFEIYPNPSNGIINIEESTGKKFEIFVYDINGKLVLRNKSIYQVNLMEYGIGTYLLQLKEGDTILESKKIFITK